jgi:hypothetical protein
MTKLKRVAFYALSTAGAMHVAIDIRNQTFFSDLSPETSLAVWVAVLWVAILAAFEPLRALPSGDSSQ